MNRQYKLKPNRISRQWARQDGMTGIGIAIILGMIAFFVLIAMRLFPVYMEHFSVTTHLENFASDPSAKNKSNGEILKKLMTSFQIDDVDNVKREHIFIERHKGGGMTVAIEYEVRTSGIGNVDLVVAFVDEVEIN
ncbi:MAG: DUF4845 domain-containing protein [Gammaproteobacteria bacterium]|nr:DUF4845 domain-containing protein [Gammaproteobacteria bacterium]